MEKLHVGQVVFILLREDHRIAPVQVVEEVVHRKLGGEETKYFVRAGPQAKAKVMPLEITKEKVFLTIDDARVYMLENATKAIEGICDDAEKFAATFEAGEQSPISVEMKAPPPTRAQTETSNQRVRMPDGEWVNLKVG
jgi:hypothetical protein